MTGKITIAVLLSFLAGCNTTNSVYQEKLQKDKFLEANYSAKPSEPKEKPAFKTQVYNETVAGEVVVGMNLTEAKIATRTFPHGPNRYNTVYWCNGEVVDRCNETCKQCAATLLAPHYTHYLQGKGDKLEVVKSLPRNIEDTVYSLKSKPYPVVNALFLNRVVTGMTIKDFQRIEQFPDTKIQYYCKNQRVFQSCLLDCSDCTLKIITPRASHYHMQTVRFKGNLDYATIVDVKESTHARQ